MTLLHHIFHSPKNPNRRPPLILIHGAGGSFLSWHPYLRRLAGETVYTLDLPGHGESQDGGRQSIEEYAAEVGAFIEESRILKPVIAGHSMGSAVAMTLALNEPEKYSGLVLLGAGAKLRVSPLILEKAGSPDTFPEAVALVNENSFNPDVPKDLLRLSNENMLKTDRQTLLGDFLACDSFDVMDRVASIQLPTLILCGTLDIMTPPKFSKTLAEKIPNSRLRLVEKAGHMLALEQPEEVAGSLKDFLDGLPPLS
jgi:pimeloyl-ACP methyl ester carboxylesterase